ncbi:MAG: hypothetical protein PVSMB8_12430 [Vulcanimicrobiaceae bacterium]
MCEASGYDRDVDAERPLRVSLAHIDHAAMLEAEGFAGDADAGELDEAMGVLNAEAVLVISLLRCGHLTRRCARTITRYDTKRNGRLIVIVNEHSQPHRMLDEIREGMQLVFTATEAAARSEALNEAAHRAFSNEA